MYIYIYIGYIYDNTTVMSGKLYSPKCTLVPFVVKNSSDTLDTFHMSYSSAGVYTIVCHCPRPAAIGITMSLDATVPFPFVALVSSLNKFDHINMYPSKNCPVYTE